MRQLGRLAGALLLAALLASPAAALAQRDRNAFTPVGQALDAATVRIELERRMQVAGQGPYPNAEAALWNTGYDFFRNFPCNQDTANAIKQGFLTARADTAEQRLLLRKAAIYWEKVHDYGIANVPVGQDFNTRDMIYYGSTAKFTTLPMSQAGAKHRPHREWRNFDWPGRNLGRREPYKGRPDNPYPGKYFPGMYPP